MNQELPDIQAVFRKSRGNRDQISTSIGSQKQKENSRKIAMSAPLTMLKPLTVWMTTNCGRFFRSDYPSGRAVRVS